MDWIEWLKGLICSEIAYLKQQNALLCTEIDNGYVTIKEIKNALERSTGVLNTCWTDLDKAHVKLQYLDDLEIQAVKWDNKHPKADISYAGRYSPFDKRKKIAIDVRLFIQPNDFVIQNDLKKHGLMVDSPLKCNNEIMQIYKHTRTKKINPYRYMFDENNVGVKEHWMFPFELREKGVGDCDDWAIELASYLIGAGVPSFRIRVVAGYTYGGYGHATVYALADDMISWHHLNSTTSINGIKTSLLTKLPKTNDENDSVGIESIWFSFSDTYSWHRWDTKGAEKTFKKEKRKGLMKYIKINGR